LGELSRSIVNYLHRVSTNNLAVVAVELLLIALVVWWAIRFLRGTRGASLVKGAAAVLVVVYLGIQLLPKEHGWERITFLYGKFLLFAFAAFIVAFQPELRRGLVQVGRVRFFGGQRQYVESEIDALVESAAHLSHNRIGAIIAIERRDRLGGLAQLGTPLDAELSAPLLKTLFHPGTTLHDMGAVIQNGRIAAAACQFPLAESEDVDASLGSRHRAALGLAQETDALVLVVSEQSGRISAACEGQLYLGLDADGLRKLLEGTLVRPARHFRFSWPGRSIRRPRGKARQESEPASSSGPALRPRDPHGP
jgi:diadenylate cyclase